MDRETYDMLWCNECERFVKDENHRCEQWSSVTKIPGEAIDRLLVDSGNPEAVFERSRVVVQVDDAALQEMKRRLTEVETKVRSLYDGLSRLGTLLRN